MKIKSVVWPVLVGILVGALAYWSQSYSNINVFGKFSAIATSAGSFLGALMLAILLRDKISKIALLVSAGVAIAVLARVFFDISYVDSKSHNLFPFEVFFMVLYSIPFSFLGAALGRNMLKSKQNATPKH